MSNLMLCSVIMWLCLASYSQGQSEEDDGYCTKASNQLMCFKTTLDWTNEVE